jgi:hypothetical protein
MTERTDALYENALELSANPLHQALACHIDTVCRQDDLHGRRPLRWLSLINIPPPHDRRRHQMQRWWLGTRIEDCSLRLMVRAINCTTYWTCPARRLHLGERHFRSRAVPPTVPTSKRLSRRGLPSTEILGEAKNRRRRRSITYDLHIETGRRNQFEAPSHGAENPLAFVSERAPAEECQKHDV